MASSLPNLTLISLKKLMKLNGNMGMIVKYGKGVGLNTKIVTATLNTQTLSMIN